MVLPHLWICKMTLVIYLTLQTLLFEHLNVIPGQFLRFAIIHNVSVVCARLLWIWGEKEKRLKVKMKGLGAVKHYYTGSGNNICTPHIKMPMVASNMNRVWLGWVTHQRGSPFPRLSVVAGSLRTRSQMWCCTTVPRRYPRRTTASQRSPFCEETRQT